MVIKRINPMSAAKVGGILGVLLGVLIGACVSLMVLAAGSAMTRMSTSEGGDLGGPPVTGMMSMFFGAGAIIILPLIYGVMSFVMSAIYAALYNLVAKWVGGLEIEAA